MDRIGERAEPGGARVLAHRGRRSLAQAVSTRHRGGVTTGAAICSGPVRNPFDAPLWQNSAFVRVWGAATISIFGSLVTRMALPLAAILILGAGALEVAVLRSLELAATLVVGLVAGAWVDRLRRRPVLIWADLGRAALLASIPIAFALDALTLWQLLAVSGLAAVLTTFFDSADNAYLPTIVERERLAEANGALAASGSAAEFMAFGISGFLVQLLTAPIAIAVDALSFVGSALLLGSIRRQEQPPPPKADREPVLRAFAGAQMALAALWGIFGATYFLFVLEELELGPAALGVIAGVGGASSFLGAVVASRATRRWGIGPVAVCAMLLSALGNAFIPLAPAGLPWLAIGCLLMQQLVADSAVTVYDITEVTVRQTLVRDRALGRVSSTFRVAAGLAQLAATLSAGVLAEVIGLRATAWLAPLGGLVGALILWASPVRRLLVLPERTPEHDGPAVAPLAAASAAATAAAAAVASERDQPVGG